jgi:hypothetical protein
LNASRDVVGLFVLAFAKRQLSIAQQPVVVEESKSLEQNKKYAGIWSSVMAVPVLVSMAVWQFYLFATFKSPAGILDLQGGKGHLWVSILVALLACILGFLVLLAFIRNDENECRP